MKTLSTKQSRLVTNFPVFYGWMILIIGTLALIMTSPGQTYVVSIFIEHFITDLDLSRSLVSTLYTVGTLVGSFALPLIGRQLDQRGARSMVVFVSVLFGLACIYMGTVRNALMLGAGFIAIRMLGQGSLSLVGRTIINRWWVRRRGLVSGLSGLAYSLFGVGAFPNLINMLIPLTGWRRTYQLLGAALIFFMAPLGYIFFRRHPELYGLEPDNGPLAPQNEPGTSLSIDEESWTVTEAIRTPPFWAASIGLALLAMLGTGLFFHMVSIFKDNGLPASVAAAVYVPISVATALINLGGGYLADRVPMRWMLALSLFSQAATLILVQFLDAPATAWLYGLLLGLTSGLMGLVNSVIWADYYGREHLGSITGITSMILIVGSALGPMPLGIARDSLGSYNLALSILAVLPFLWGILNLVVGRPERQSAKG